MSLKQTLKTNSMTQGLYRKLADTKHRIDRERRFSWKKAKRTFVSRSKGHKKLLILLAGYKAFLYDNTFERIKRFVDDDIDVCVVTSGLWSDDIASRCEKNDWSYLSTKVNNVSLVQNLAIYLHPNAKFIYKMDEDIFVTKGAFSKLYETLLDCERHGDYIPSFVSPLLPINGYGHLRILKKLGFEKEYGEKFEKPKYAVGPSHMIEGSADVAKYFWGGVFNITALNEEFGAEPFSYTACPIRLSIGFILFRRETWEKMGSFIVERGSTGMGKDEEQICSLAMINGLAAIVSENVVCGHLAFGGQNKEMKKFYLENPELFAID